MSIPAPTPRVTATEKLSAQELKDFMKRHGFSEKEMAEFLGKTVQGIKLWLQGQREINVTVSRLLKLMDKYPQLIREF